MVLYLRVNDVYKTCTASLTLSVIYKLSSNLIGVMYRILGSESSFSSL